MEIEFNQVIDLTLEHEGGYVNDPDDMGGETNFGISKRSFPDLNIKSLTKDDAKKIYFSNYWKPGKCEELPNEIKYAHFEACVNMGISSANKVLQRAGGVDDDGIWGKNTKRAAESVNLDAYVLQMALRYMYIIGNRHSNAKYANGWANRVKSIISKTKKLLL